MAENLFAIFREEKKEALNNSHNVLNARYCCYRRHRRPANSVLWAMAAYALPYSDSHVQTVNT